MVEHTTRRNMVAVFLIVPLQNVSKRLFLRLRLIVSPLTSIIMIAMMRLSVLVGTQISQRQNKQINLCSIL